MSLKRPLPLDFCSTEIKDPKRSLTEIEEIILPEEVLIQIWSYLDFKTVQRSCTRVSKSWLEMIRSSKLSWKMKLRSTFYYPDVFSPSMDMLGPKDFNEMLLHWNSLGNIHVLRKHIGGREGVSQMLTFAYGGRGQGVILT